MAAIAAFILGLAAAGAAAPAAGTGQAANATGRLSVWVDHLPRGLRPRVNVVGPGARRPITSRQGTLRLRPGVYTVAARPVAAGSRRFYPRRAALRVRVRAGGTALALVDYVNVVPRTTRPFTRAMARRLRSATPTRLVFAGAAAVGLRRGDVLVGGPTRGLPQGIVRRVVAIGVEGGDTIVRTGRAGLTDALPRGGIDLSAAPRAGRARRAAGQVANDVVERLPGVRLEIDRTFAQRDASGKGCTAAGDVTLRGGLFIEPTVRMSTSWRFFSLRKATFSGTLSERAEVALGAELTGECRLDYTTRAVRIASFGLPVGPIVVPVTAELSAHVSLRTRGTVSAAAAVRQEASLTGGLTYGGGKLKIIRSALTTFTVEPPRIGAIEGTATLRAGPRLTLRIAGVAGASLGADGVLDLDVTPLQDPIWSLYGGITIDAGLDLFNLRKSVDVFSYRLPSPIATARSAAGGSTPPDLGLPPVRTRSLGDAFDRPDLGARPVDTLPEGTPLTLTCVTRGAPVSGVSGVSDVWYGLDTNDFVPGVYVVATAGIPVLPECPRAAPAPETPPAPRPSPRPQPKPEPRPDPGPAPGPVVPPDADGDGVPDASDTCPAAAGVAPKGCPRQRGIARTPDGGGYWLAAEDGGVFSFGSAPFHGSEAGAPLGAPVIAIAATPSGVGYWTAGKDGGVFAHGDAPFKGSLPSLGVTPNKPVVGIVATPSGQGYWLVAEDGGVFAFGDAGHFGSAATLTLNAPIVGMAATPDGGGYWLVGADGGVFTFGNAPFPGSLVGTTLNAPIVGAARTPDGGGLWLVGGDGGVFTLGNAGFHQSLAGQPLNQPIVGIAPTPDGGGYWLLGGDGGVFAFGNAQYRGGTA
jgi:hypothetical protein